MLRCLTRHARLFTSANHGRRWSSIATAETDEGLYLPGTKLQLQIQPQSSKAFEPLAATVVKRFEPITVGTVLVQRHSDNEKAILKLADRRLGYRSNNKGVDTVPWTSSIDDHLRRAVHDIQAGAIPNWFELINDSDNQPDEELWEDWSTDCKAGTFPVFSVSCVSESTPLHPITDFVQGLALEYIPGICMEKLKPGADISQQEAEAISGQVMEGLRAIEAENHVLHNDIHIGNVVLREEDRSAIIIDFGQATVREPGRSDEDWMRVVRGGADTRFMRRVLKDPENGGWKRTVTPFEMSDSSYNSPLKFNDYVESMPDDFRMATFDRVLDTDWEGAREKVHQWRIRPGVRCRPSYDYDYGGLKISLSLLDATNKSMLTSFNSPHLDGTPEKNFAVLHGRVFSFLLYDIHLSYPNRQIDSTDNHKWASQASKVAQIMQMFAGLCKSKS